MGSFLFNFGWIVGAIFHNFDVFLIKFETLLMLKLQESQRLKAYNTDEMVEESAGCTLCIGLYPQSEDHSACTYDLSVIFR